MLFPDNGDNAGYIDDRFGGYPRVLTQQIGLGSHPAIGVLILAPRRRRRGHRDPHNGPGSMAPSPPSPCCPRSPSAPTSGWSVGTTSRSPRGCSTSRRSRSLAAVALRVARSRSALRRGLRRGAAAVPRRRPRRRSCPATSSRSRTSTGRVSSRSDRPIHASRPSFDAVARLHPPRRHHRLLSGRAR